jgi:hypothetical protein
MVKKEKTYPLNNYKSIQKWYIYMNDLWIINISFISNGFIIIIIIIIIFFC